MGRAEDGRGAGGDEEVECALRGGRVEGEPAW